MTVGLFHNPAKDPALHARPLAPGDDPGPFHRSLPGYRPTPLLAAPAIADHLGLAEVWVKVESDRLGLPSFKVLGASWATYRLLGQVLVERGLPPPAAPTLDALRHALASAPPLTLVAATEGNHGRAVARVARLVGCRSRIFVPDDMAASRMEAITTEGAEVTAVAGTYDDAVRAAARAAGGDVLAVSDTAWPGYTTVPGWVVDGYRTIYAEVREQLRSAPDVVAVQMGVGSLAAATVDALAGETTIVAVEPEGAACGLQSARAGRPVAVPTRRSLMAGLDCGQVSPVAWPRLQAGVDIFVTADDAAASDAVRWLASSGVATGATGAAGLAGLTHVAAGGELGGARALVVCTEGPTDPAAYEAILAGGVSRPRT